MAQNTLLASSMAGIQEASTLSKNISIQRPDPMGRSSTYFRRYPKSEKGRSVRRSNSFSARLWALLAGHYSYKKTESFVQKADRSSGEVVDLKEIDPSDGGSSTYAAVVEYTDRNGQKHRVVDSFSSSPPSYRRGQTVSILYNREKPGDARIDRGPWNFWLTVLCGSFGAMFSFLALRSARKGLRRQA